MEIEKVTYEKYDSIFINIAHKFNSGLFNELNSYKCEELFFLIFRDTKIRLGIILGLRKNELFSPFSAPYGGFEALKDDVKLYQIDSALITLQNWIIVNKYKGLRLIQAPYFYQPNFNFKLSNCLFRSRFEILNSEINYHFLTSKIDEKYNENIWSNARKNLNQSLLHSLVFEKIPSSDSEVAYKIIKQNREERGFPLRLSLIQLKETEALIDIDYFIVKKGNQIIAAAIVFQVSSKIVRVVYWGDLPSFSSYKSMNFLSFNIFKFYKENGFEFIDIGHSTVESLPNHGLCEFKESIGCDLSILNEYYFLNKDVCS